MLQITSVCNFLLYSFWGKEVLKIYHSYFFVFDLNILHICCFFPHYCFLAVRSSDWKLFFLYYIFRNYFIGGILVLKFQRLTSFHPHLPFLQSQFCWISNPKDSNFSLSISHTMKIVCFLPSLIISVTQFAKLIVNLIVTPLFTDPGDLIFSLVAFKIYLSLFGPFTKCICKWIFRYFKMYLSFLEIVGLSRGWVTELNSGNS